MRELINKAIKVNTALVFSAALVFIFLRKFSFSAGLLISCLWSTLNFALTLNLLEIAVLHKSKTKLLLLLLIKFPVLYLVGFLILFMNKFPVSSLFLGVSSIALVTGVLSIWPQRNKPNTNCQI